MITETKAQQMRRHRGQILEFVEINHREQASRLDDIALWGVMTKLHGSEIGQDYILTLLQDLFDRGYLYFHSERNRWTGRVQISKIQITPRGRDLLERTHEDASVLIP